MPITDSVKLNPDERLTWKLLIKNKIKQKINQGSYTGLSEGNRDYLSKIRY